MDIQVGVHQGSALNPLPFVVTLVYGVNQLEDGAHRTIVYLDDIALADSQEELEERV